MAKDEQKGAAETPANKDETVQEIVPNREIITINGAGSDSVEQGVQRIALSEKNAAEGRSDTATNEQGSATISPEDSARVPLGKLPPDAFLSRLQMTLQAKANLEQELAGVRLEIRQVRDSEAKFKKRAGLLRQELLKRNQKDKERRAGPKQRRGKIREPKLDPEAPRRISPNDMGTFLYGGE